MEGFGISLVAFGILFGAFLLFRASQRKHLQAAQAAGLIPPAGRKPNLDDVKKLALAGEKILAIKYYREINPKVGLAEAKDAVEALAQQAPAATK